jgi:hypothetical protein
MVLNELLTGIARVNTITPGIIITSLAKDEKSGLKKTRQRGHAGPVGARLAGEGVLESAFAGKPGSYEKRFTRELRWNRRVRGTPADCYTQSFGMI